MVIYLINIFANIYFGMIDRYNRELAKQLDIVDLVITGLSYCLGFGYGFSIQRVSDGRSLHPRSIKEFYFTDGDYCQEYGGKYATFLVRAADPNKKQNESYKGVRPYFIVDGVEYLFEKPARLCVCSVREPKEELVLAIDFGVEYEGKE
jgi:hypothetical protein